MNYLSVLFWGNLTVCWYIFKYLFLYFEGKTYWGITRIYKSVVVRPILDSCLSAFLCLEQRIRIATVGRYSGISWRKQAGGTVSVVRFCTNWITASWISLTDNTYYHNSADPQSPGIYRRWFRAIGLYARRIFCLYPRELPRHCHMVPTYGL